MKTQIKNYSTKLLLTALTAIGILTATTFAQQTNDKFDGAKRGQMAEQMRRQAAQSKSLAAEKGGARAVDPAALTSGALFLNGKELTMAMYDAEWMDEDEEAFNYTIIDLVYLIDRLDGQPEAAQLQKTLRAVVRGTLSGALVKKDIEKTSDAYFARQKTDGKWYFNAGKTSMNLMIASYTSEDAKIKKSLTDLQALIKTAPKGTAAEILNPMGALAKYVEQKTFTDEDYTAISEGVSEIMVAGAV